MIYKRFCEFKSQHVSDGMAPPVGEGVLIFDEVKVYYINVVIV